MAVSKEGLYSRVLDQFSPEQLRVDSNPNLSNDQKNLLFAMHCNGYYLGQADGWYFNKNAVKQFVQDFETQRVSFFGPRPIEHFYTYQNHIPQVLDAGLGQSSVLEAIGKYRSLDQDLAARIAFIFGGIGRETAFVRGEKMNLAHIAKALDYSAKITMLGEAKSGLALASAAAMYVLSGGSLEEDRGFNREVYTMSDAISQDPVEVLETVDLGLSQVARLRNFQNIKAGNWYKPLPEIGEDLAVLQKFPTFGAEFHFPLDQAQKDPRLWKKLALLNMSQYHHGSYIQLGRNDQGVIEVRMNPSVYPVTVANWHHMRTILGQLDRAFFTATINRRSQQDFVWTNDVDNLLLNNLRALGMISYAAVKENVPAGGKSADINFGGIYLGQTVRVNGPVYDFSGNWGAKPEGEYGQLAVYAGFGDNLAYLAYHLSMALVSPQVLKGVDKNVLSRVRTLREALELSHSQRQRIFTSIEDRITADSDLNQARSAGRRIFDALYF